MKFGMTGVNEAPLVKNYVKGRPGAPTLRGRLLVIAFALLLGAGLQVLRGYEAFGDQGLYLLVLPPIVAGILMYVIRRMDEWERAVILRFGAFHKVKGPGLFLLLPLADRISRIVDLRIRVCDFSAETTLTKDAVPVTVDALCFWMVWDAEKAICEVQTYEEAVVLSAKTALRSAISTHNLSVFLERDEMIEERIRAAVDQKTTDWGITVQHIEITDIQIPEDLRESLSAMARAERERNARILLAEAEVEVARKMREASEVYGENGTALALKKLEVLREGLQAGTSMVLIPGQLDPAQGGAPLDIFGLEALARLARKEKEESHEGS